MSVTLREILAAARTRRASVAAELAGYLVLAAADQVATAPRRAEPAMLELGEDGIVRVTGGLACPAADAEVALRSLLSQLLAVANSATPALFRAAQAPARDGVDALVVELETALIPVNRAASRRALARLYRETARALAAGQVALDAAPPLEPPPLPEPPLPEPPRPPDESESRADAIADVAPIEQPAEPQSDELRVPDLVLPSAAVPGPPLTVLPDVAPRLAQSAVLVEHETCPEPVIARASARRAAIARAGARTPLLGSLAFEYPASDDAPSPTEPMDFSATDPMFECEFLMDSEPGAVAVEPGRPSATEAAPGHAEIDVEEDWIEVDDFDGGDDEAMLVFDDEHDSAQHSDPLACSALMTWTDEDVERGWSAEPEVVAPRSATPPEPAPDEPERPRFGPRRSDVSELLAGFRVQDARSEREVRRDLKRIAELGPTLSDTPPPAAAGGGRNR